MRRLRLALGAAVILAAAILPISAAQAGTVDPIGPINSLTISTDLNCQVDLVGSGAAFRSGNACGTLVAAHDMLYKPASLPIGSGSSASSRNWIPISQEIKGNGSPNNPYFINTLTSGWGVSVLQSDRYVDGETSYTTTIQITNTADAGTVIQLYRLADCDFSPSHLSYGQYDSANRVVTCRAPGSTGAYSAKARAIQFSGSGSHYIYGAPAELWQSVDQRQQLPDRVTGGTTQAIDGAIGLSWSRTLEPGQIATFTMRTTFQAEVSPPVTPTPPPSSPTTTAPVDPPPATNPTRRPTVPGNYPPAGQIVQVEPPAVVDSELPIAPPSTTGPTIIMTPSPSASASATAEPLDPDSGGLKGFLTSPWFYVLAGLLLAGGAGGAVVLRRHGDHE
ncbi:MAG: hypothetical protein LBK54_10840 [Propionibacteriaceae bacterium]|jgi:hypothetical protein|nr:hypothetical protein [Propionibacteriaceae bacterium]